MPDVVGSSRDEAVQELTRLGLDPHVVEVSSDREIGVVTAQAPEPSTVLVSGSQVRINVSKGPKQVAVPSVIGLNVDQATAQLQGAGFAVQRRDVDDDQPTDVVIAQVPEGLTLAAKGSTVTLTVSRGPTTSLVPDVTTLAAADARATLQASGFRTTITREETDDPALDGVVLRQEPVGGAQEEPGTRITLVVGRFVEPPPAVTEPPPAPPPPPPTVEPPPPTVEPPPPPPTDDDDTPSDDHRADDAVTPKPRLRVAVLAGGRSSEHAISVASARSVLAALDPERYEAVSIEIGRQGKWQLGTVPERGLSPPSDHASAVETLPVVGRFARRRRHSAPSTWSCRSCTAPSARTEPSRGCSSSRMSPTSARACSPPRSAWTRTSSSR